MITASTSIAAAEPFTPSWMDGQPGAAVIFIRAGDVVERELFEAQLASPALRAGEVWPWEKHATLLDGLKAIGGEDAGHLIALAETAAGGVLEEAGEIALLDQARALVGQHYGPYRMLIEQEDRRRAVLPVMAFCRYCVRWENVDAEMKRGLDGLIDPASLTKVLPPLMRSAGVEAYNRQYAVTAQKNSDALLKSGADPKTSQSDEPLEKDGSSPGSTILKTPD